MFRFIFLLAISFWFIPSNASAQYYEFGLGVGGAIYNGDLDAPELSTNLGNVELSGQLLLRYVVNRKIAVRGNLTLGKLSGDDRKSSLDYQKIRNLRFTSKLVEMALMGEYYIFGFDARSSDEIFSPYLTIGVGLFFFNPKTDYQGEMYELQPLGTEGQGLPGMPDRYSKSAFAVPFGGGVKYKLNDKFNLGFELIVRKAFTDYIDDLSTTYANTDDLLATYGPISAALADRRSEALGFPVETIPGAQRGGAGVDDYYYTIMFTLTANFESIFGIGKPKSSMDCPTF